MYVTPRKQARNNIGSSAERSAHQQPRCCCCILPDTAVCGPAHSNQNEPKSQLKRCTLPRVIHEQQHNNHAACSTRPTQLEPKGGKNPEPRTLVCAGCFLHHQMYCMSFSVPHIHIPGARYVHRSNCMLPNHVPPLEAFGLQICKRLHTAGYPR